MFVPSVGVFTLNWYPCFQPRGIHNNFTSFVHEAGLVCLISRFLLKQLTCSSKHT